MISPIHLINWISFCLQMIRTFSMVVRISASLELAVNREIAIVCNWLMANKVSLNTEKSSFVIFRQYQKWMNFDITIKFFDHDKNFFILLERKDYVKYLEILIDSNLTSKQYILFISFKDQQISWNYFKVKTLCFHWYFAKHISVFDSAPQNLWYCWMGPSCSN